MAERIRVTFDPELRRRRLPVLLRLPLAVPPAVGLLLWTAAAAVALVVSWVVALVRGSVPELLHRAQLRYLVAWTRFAAWLTLAAQTASIHAARVEQRRVTILLRPLLALPAIVLASVFAVTVAWTAVAGWFVAVACARTTEGLRELGAFCIRYLAETLAYVLLVTPYPPRLAPPARDVR